MWLQILDAHRGKVLGSVSTMKPIPFRNIGRIIVLSSVPDPLFATNKKSICCMCWKKYGTECNKNKVLENKDKVREIKLPTAHEVMWEERK